MPYLLDSNVFIEAKNRHYGFDFCPAFWDWIDRAHADGTVFSIDKVAGELMAGDDELVEWARQRDQTFFLGADEALLPALRAVSAWAYSADYEPVAIATFLDVADYFLVAQAHAHGHVVVTHERLSSSTKRIQVPNACLGVGAHSVTPFQMLRTERARFILGT